MKASAGEIFRGVAILVIGAILSQIGTRLNEIKDERSASVGFSSLIIPDVMLTKSCEKLRELGGDISLYDDSIKKDYTINRVSNFYNTSYFDLSSMCENPSSSGRNAITIEVFYKNDTKRIVKDIVVNTGQNYVAIAYVTIGGRDHKEVESKNGKEFALGDIPPGEFFSFTGYLSSRGVYKNDISLTTSSQKEVGINFMHSTYEGIYTSYIKSSTNLILLILMVIIATVGLTFFAQYKYRQKEDIKNLLVNSKDKAI